MLQVKIMKNPELLHTASEQFLGKKEHEIKSTVLQTLEGHLRAILGTLTVEEVNIYIISTLSTPGEVPRLHRGKQLGLHGDGEQTDR